MDAREFLKSGGFLKKAELRANGPRRLTIADVEQAEGFPGRDGAPATELCLVFTDGTKQSLRTVENLRRVIQWFGNDTNCWVGQEVEAYFSPDVPNPRGGEPGGIRLQRPTDAVEEPYVSDLEEEPVKGNGAERRPSAKAKSVKGTGSRAKPVASEVDDDPVL